MKKLLILLAIFFLVGISYAENNTTTITTSGYPFYNETLHIENGQCVPLNATVDIASLGWGVPKISYYGRYEDSFSIPNGSDVIKSITMPNTVSKLSKYYIGPTEFENYIGYWYQNYNRDADQQGNVRMFKVNYTCPPKVVKEIIVPNFTTTEKIIPDKLEDLNERREASILIARGDNSMIQYIDTPSHWWMFGIGNGIMDENTTTNGKFFIPSSQTKSFRTGSYDVVVVQPGPNKLYEATYQPDYKFPGNTFTSKVIISPIRSVTPIDITSMFENPKVVEDRLIGSVKKSIDDTYKIYTVSFQEPEIQITRLDVLTNPSNDSYYDLRGYTNMINGTVLTVKIDPKAINSKNKQFRVFTTKAFGADPGVWRQFNTVIPAVDLSPGFHDIEISAPNGANQIVQVYKYKDLAPHVTPPPFVEYYGASPFITPVKIIQTVTVPVPGPTVFITITPSVEQIEAAQNKAVNNSFWGWVITIGIILIMVFVLYLLVPRSIKYAISVYKRLYLK
jgi:hypothetical protein